MTCSAFILKCLLSSSIIFSSTFTKGSLYGGSIGCLACENNVEAFNWPRIHNIWWSSRNGHRLARWLDLLSLFDFCISFIQLTKLTLLFWVPYKPKYVGSNKLQEFKGVSIVIVYLSDSNRDEAAATAVTGLGFGFPILFDWLNIFESSCSQNWSMPCKKSSP